MKWPEMLAYQTKEVQIGTVSKEELDQENLLKKRQEKPREDFANNHYKNFSSMLRQIEGTRYYLDAGEGEVSIADKSNHIHNVTMVFDDFDGQREQFFWSNQAQRLCVKKNGRRVDVANFLIISSTDFIEVERDGSRKCFAQLNLMLQDGQEKSVKIENEKMCDLSNEIRRRCRLCHVFSYGDFALYVSNFYAEYEKNQKNSIYIYRFYGWKKDDAGLLYLHGGMKNVEAKVTLNPDVSKAKRFLYCYWRASSDRGKLLILLFYCLWSYLSAFYADRKIDGCRSVLYLVAPTGTGKTSLAKILVGALLDEGQKVSLRFDDTIASLQESIYESSDRPVLVDDFYPKGNRLDDLDFQRKASEITRIAGDGMIKGKMGPNRKPLPDRNYEGGIIGTGETIDMNTHSSYLRCWILPFSAGSIFLDENLSCLQKNPDLAQAFFSLWILWLQKNQQKILSELPQLHDTNLSICRQKFSKEYPRLLSNIATFFDICVLFKGFSQALHYDFDYEESFDMVLKESTMQFDFLQSLSPEEIVVEALNEAVDNGTLVIAEKEQLFRQQQFDGFFDADFIFVITGRLEDVVEKFASKKHYGVKLSVGLKASLIEKNILVSTGGSGNLKYSKDREVIPKRPRLYKLKRSVLKNG